jgi:hypothetical protein
MLEKLDKINWSELDDAYGWATNVPTMIRDLTSSEKVVRQKAIYSLYSHIIHQGTPYSSTAFAIPFLVELLQMPATLDREEIASLLVFIAEYCSDLQQHVLVRPQIPETTIPSWTSWLTDDRDDAQKQADEVEYEGYKNAIIDSWRTVNSFVPVYSDLLKGSDSQTRIQLQKLLTICREI